MKRYCQTLELYNDKELIKAYVAEHAHVWDEVKAGIREVGIIDMQIYIDGNRLFMIMDTTDDFDMERDYARLATLPRQADNTADAGAGNSDLDGSEYSTSDDRPGDMIHDPDIGGPTVYSKNVDIGQLDAPPPAADVEGFRRNGGRNCKLCGHWKVYGQVEEAQRRFLAFDRCREALCRWVAEGRSLEQLFPAV